MLLPINSQLCLIYFITFRSPECFISRLMFILIQPHPARRESNGGQTLPFVMAEVPFPGGVVGLRDSRFRGRQS
jgi:hypothetical protein